MRLVIIWMIIIFLTSSFPYLSRIYDGTWSQYPHDLLINTAHIKWNVVFSSKNPFFRIPDYDSFFVLLSKSGHVFVFTILGWLCYRTTRKIGTSLWICIAYSFFDELHQAFTPGRTSRWVDVALDIVMALLAILVAVWFYNNNRTFLKRKKKPDLPT